MSKKDLIQYTGRSTPSERHENAVKAGLASGVSRQRRRQMREVISNILTVEVTDEEIRAELENNGLPSTLEAAMCYAAIKRAIRGDIEAARFVRDTLGEKPLSTLAVTPLSELPPVEYMDMSQYSDDELRRMAAYLSENQGN